MKRLPKHELIMKDYGKEKSIHMVKLMKKVSDIKEKHGILKSRKYKIRIK